MKRWLLPLLLLLGSFEAYAQSDTTATAIGPVQVTAPFLNNASNSTTPSQTLTTKEIEALPVLQLSDALKFMSGIVVRDYGGVGGLKTVAARGFSAQHTAFAYDGVVVSDCQTGQIDLGKFSINNLLSIRLVNGNSDFTLLPAQHYASANLITATTRQPLFIEKPVNVRAEMVSGSFGLQNPMVVVENLLFKEKGTEKPKLTSSILVNYMQSNGDFPFTLSYGNDGDSTSLEQRSNSKIIAINTEMNLHAYFNQQSQLHLKVYYYNSKRELPGAVIYYSQPNGQILWDQNLFAQAQYRNNFTKKISYLLSAKANYAYQRYLDPEYLNIEGKLDNSYWQNEYYISNAMRYKPYRFLSLSLANDFLYNKMDANIRFFVNPSRLTSLTHALAAFEWKRIKGDVGLLHTYMHHWTKTGDAPESNSHFSPSVSVSFKLLKNSNFYINAFYKNIFRAPSFNDLYYREVGNLDLEPENTHQFNLGLSFSKAYFHNRMHISVAGNGYYNIVENKIVAIPNQNLFTWSMMNYGEVRIGGAEAQVAYEYRIINALSLAISGNYTFQYAVDVTNPESKTYLHQIPYTPLHSGSAHFSILNKWIKCSYSFTTAGKRYTTSQNKENSSLSPYIDHSIAFFNDYSIKIKKNGKQSIILGFKLEFLNIANAQYEIIRNYPMPGRAIRVGVNFKW